MDLIKLGGHVVVLLKNAIRRNRRSRFRDFYDLVRILVFTKNLRTKMIDVTLTVIVGVF